MFKNYFKIAWRNLIQGKAFSIINISGLAVGMAGAVLILLWLHNESSYDKFHEKKDRLYEVYGLHLQMVNFKLLNKQNNLWGRH